MSSIIAIEKNGIVYVGCDASTECFGVNFYLNNENNLSIRKMPSNIIVAASGPLKVAQRLFMNEELFVLKEDEVFDKKYIVQKIIPKFYNISYDVIKWKKDEFTNCYNTESQFIVIKDSDIYLISKDLSVVKCKEIVCISDQNNEKEMYSFAKSIIEENPESIIKKTFKYLSDNKYSFFNHGFIINTKDYILKKVEDINVNN